MAILTDIAGTALRVIPAVIGGYLGGMSGATTGYSIGQQISDQVLPYDQRLATKATISDRDASVGFGTARGGKGRVENTYENVDVLNNFEKWAQYSDMINTAAAPIGSMMGGGALNNTAPKGAAEEGGKAAFDITGEGLGAEPLHELPSTIGSVNKPKKWSVGKIGQAIDIGDVTDMFSEVNNDVNNVNLTRTGQKLPTFYSTMSGQVRSENQIGSDIPYLGMYPSLKRYNY